MIRVRAWQTLLAAVATMMAAWPATTLFVGNTWVLGTLGLVALAALLGMLGRFLDLPPTLIVCGQLLGVIVVALVVHLPDHLDRTLPAAIRALGADAHHTVTAYAAPAPTTVGIIFFIQVIIAILAITVDFLAVTGRSPALAGVPLLVEFTISAANSGGSLHPKYFLALGIAWLAMLYAASERAAQDWSGLRAHRSGSATPTTRLGGHDFGPLTRLAGVAALVVALVVAGALPAASQKFVTKGLARGSGSPATVGFSADLDLKANLTDQDRTPVLTFRTTDPSPPPLRALVADNYIDGHWTRTQASYLLRGTDGDPLQRSSDNPIPASANPYRMTVSQNTMRTPYVVAPTQVRTGDFGDRTWSYNPKTTQPSTSARIKSYTVSYLVQSAAARPAPGRVDPDRFSSDLAVDLASSKSIATFVERAAPRGSPFDRAMAIQSYLRDGGGFTYSLTLAPTRKDSRGRSLDPISNFLATKLGYCVQFASTMVMAARSIGIPARLGIGFLPGTAGANGTYQVLQSDAHAWPELYFPGLGWTRFEPTSASRSGAAPSYSTPLIRGGTESAPPRRSVAPPSRASSGPSSSTSVARTTGTTSSGRNLHLDWVFGALAVLLLLATALSVLPLLARRSRRELTRDDGNADSVRVQAQWEDLVVRMEDLGIERAPDVSPRSQEQYYTLRLVVGTQGQESLHRAVTVLERARYTDQSDGHADLRAPADDLIERIRRSRSTSARWRASLFPRSGRRALRRIFTPRGRR